MESRIHREVYVRFGGEYLKPTLEIMQGVGYLAYLTMSILKQAKAYQSNKKSYHQIRNISDELCKNIISA